MNCPSCDHEMTPGVAQVRGTALGFLFVGISMQDLMFDGADGSRPILGSREERAAHACPHCGGLFVVGPSPSRGPFVDPETGIVTEIDGGESR